MSPEAKALLSFERWLRKHHDALSPEVFAQAERVRLDLRMMVMNGENYPPELRQVAMDETTKLAAMLRQ